MDFQKIDEEDSLEMEKDISPLGRNFSKAKTYFDEFEDEGKHWLEKMEFLKSEHEDIVEKKHELGANWQNKQALIPEGVSIKDIGEIEHNLDKKMGKWRKSDFPDTSLNSMQQV